VIIAATPCRLFSITSRSRASLLSISQACSRSPPTPSGFSALRLDAVMKPSSDMLVLKTTVLMVCLGALYHHFESKLAIFDALLIELEQEFIATVRRIASPDAPAWTNLVAGCHAFLDSCLRPDVQRLALIDGPAVLGPARWREIEDQYALVPVLNGLTGSMREGTVAPRPPAPLARMLLAAINEAGLIIAQSPRPREARQEAGDAFDALLHGLRRTPEGV